MCALVPESQARGAEYGCNLINVDEDSVVVYVVDGETAASQPSRQQ